MKIALVGIPGSKKTRYANALKRDEGYTVIDNIPQKFAKATGLMIGPEADYRVDLSLSGIRFAEYYKAKAKTDDFVMTTTYLDSLAYSFSTFDDLEMLDMINSGGVGPDLLDKTGDFPYFFSGIMLTLVLRHSWLFDKTILFPPNEKASVEFAKIAYYHKEILNDNGIEYEIASDSK